MKNAVQIVDESIADHGPRPGQEFVNWCRYGQLIVEDLKRCLETSEGREYSNDRQYNECDNVDDDQLYVRVVVSLKSVFKFPQHKISIMSPSLAAPVTDQYKSKNNSSKMRKMSHTASTHQKRHSTQHPYEVLGFDGNRGNQ